MLKGKILSHYTNLFSLNEYDKNHKKILKYFKQLKSLRWKNYIASFVVGIENLKILKYYTFSKKTSILSIICSKCKNEDKKYLNKKNQLRF